MEPVYYGESDCEAILGSGKNKGTQCKNKAYFEIGVAGDGVSAKYICGMHSKGKDEAVELPKRSRKEVQERTEDEYKQRQTEIEEARAKNVKEGKKGTIILLRMRMRHTPEYVQGFLNVFPNYRHDNRADGYGCSELSPMKLGPVEHGQPGLPPSLNIENFHQGNKCFQEEVDSHNNPTQLYYDNRLKFYLDSVPHRHKYKGTAANKNIPLYSIWVDKNGKEHRIDYITSRQFYCTFYDRLAGGVAGDGVPATKAFAKLQQMVNDGYNLAISGYDAYGEKETAEKSYLDSSSPFGHEKVLKCMLLEEYPWRKYKTFEF